MNPTRPWRWAGTGPLVRATASLTRLVAGDSPELLAPPMNVLRHCPPSSVVWPSTS
ncbi:hypothetical protein [Deinococcus hopiensis]|uniref:hypothetical protein n=1 Tax=Deinococcus hopiensis TaxID=309885 RepID=UPI0014830C54|nr:hypothetical protein [Deinococcus hopiensis]